MNEYIFDCWYKSDGIPFCKFIKADSEEEAIKMFETDNPDLGYDYPYQ